MEQNNYLAHHGVKGMKWKNHTYKSIVGGEYVYDRQQLSNTAADLKRQGYSTAEIRPILRSQMASQRATNAKLATDYSGAAERAKTNIQNQNTQAKASTNKYADQVKSARENAAKEAEERNARLAVENKQREERLAKEKQEKKEQEQRIKEQKEAEAAAKEKEKEDKKKAKEEEKKKKEAEREAKKKQKEAEKAAKAKEKAASSKTSEAEIQKRVDQGVQKALAAMGLSANYLNKEGTAQKMDENQLNSLANAVIRGELGNGSTRKAALGEAYADVQKIVNNKMSQVKVAKVSPKEEEKKEVKYGASKRVKHSMIQTNYLEHHGILGQRWGVRRYQNADGTLTPAGIKRYTKWDKNEGKRVLNRKGKKMYDAQIKKAVKEKAKENKKLVKKRSLLTNEELSELAKRFGDEKKLAEAYENSTVVGRFKSQYVSALSKKGADALADLTVNAAINAGTAAINSKLNTNLGKVTVDSYLDDYGISKVKTIYNEAVRSSNAKLADAQDKRDKVYNRKNSSDEEKRIADNELDIAKRHNKDEIASAKNQLEIDKQGLYSSAKSEMDKFVASSKTANLELSKSYFRQRDKK